MRETEHAASSTIRKRLAALSSLYKHLVRHDHAARKPVGEVERPAINRDDPGLLEAAGPQTARFAWPRIPSQDCAVARFFRSACRSVCAAPRSPRSRSGICTRGSTSPNRAMSRRMRSKVGTAPIRGSSTRTGQGASGRAGRVVVRDQALEQAGRQQSLGRCGDRLRGVATNIPRPPVPLAPD
jgi:hypothetical protein